MFVISFRIFRLGLCSTGCLTDHIQVILCVDMTVMVMMMMMMMMMILMSDDIVYVAQSFIS